MKKLIGSWFIFLFAGSALMTAGMQAATAQVGKSTMWRDAVVTDLSVKFADTGFHARWNYHRCHCGDLLIQVEQVAPDGILTGELLMLDGQVLLARGFEQQGTDLAPLMQAPSLMLQLVYALLNRSQPKGPVAVTGRQAWDVEEEKIDFNLDTGMVSGTFAAPWSIKGLGWRADAGHQRFELSFRFSSPETGQAGDNALMTLSGMLDYRKQAFPVSESTSLEGWKAQWLGLNEHKSKRVAEGLTLKALRQQTREDR